MVTDDEEREECTNDKLYNERGTGVSFYRKPKRGERITQRWIINMRQNEKEDDDDHHRSHDTAADDEQWLYSFISHSFILQSLYHHPFIYWTKTQICSLHPENNSLFSHSASFM